MLESDEGGGVEIQFGRKYTPLYKKGIKKPQIKTMETTFTKKIAMEATAYIKQTCKLA